MTASLDLVVSTDWLAAHRDDPNLAIVDVRPADRYAAGHIPGARNADLYRLKLPSSDPDSVAAWVEAVQAAFRRLGIHQGDRVVFYEEVSGTLAAWGVWLTRALTIGAGMMLDGGLAAWLEAGHSLDSAPAEVAASDLQVALDRSSFATADDVLAAIAGDGGIVDTRGDLEWMQGAIPTARHLEWIHHLSADGSLRPVEELRALYRQLGVTPDDDVITYCAGGFRAAHAWLVLTMLGYDHVRNYAPSWGEWGRRPDLPVAPTR